MAGQGEPAAPTWLAISMLILAGLLVAVIVFVGTQTLPASAALCDPHFPVRNGGLPSWVYVFSAIAAFGLGHLAGQWGIWRRGASQMELGRGRWSNSAAVIAVDASVALFLFVVTGLLLLEAFTIGHHLWPITYYVRCANDAGSLISLGGSVVYAFVIGRWMWVFKD